MSPAAVLHYIDISTGVDQTIERGSLSAERLAMAHRMLSDPTAHGYAKSAGGKIGGLRARPVESSGIRLIQLSWLPLAAPPEVDLAVMGVGLERGSTLEHTRCWNALKASSMKVHFKAHRPPNVIPWVGVSIQPTLFEQPEATEVLQEMICALAFAQLDGGEFEEDIERASQLLIARSSPSG